MIDWLRRSFGPLEARPNADRSVTVHTDAAIRARRMRVQARSIDPFASFPDLDTQLLAVQGISDRPWRAAGLAEILGVPAIWGGVNLIANTIGSMTMRALRNEVEVPPEDRPRVIVRPDPFTIPREFYRMTGYNIVTRGENWWWIARRDGDGNALSVINVPPQEVTVTENPLDLLRPTIRWRNRIMPNEDMRQLVYAREPGSYRGIGPLQVCQAALSVAVEAQEWAANFYADGGLPPLWIKSSVPLGGDPEDPTDPDSLSEAELLAESWNAKGNNRPRVSDDTVEDVKQFDWNPNGAQMLDARMFQNGEAARMLQIPGELLEYAMSGSSLTYQNLATIYQDFLRRCLRPNYLTTIEQSMSDLLPRSTVARFDTDNLTLQDPKTRYETYQIGIDTGILTVEQAQAFEGIQPGDTDNAPVPFSVPQAVPERLPIQNRAQAPVRCDGRRLLKGVLRPCNKLLAEHGPFSGTCERCGKVHVAAA